jgi:hypothetical protein
MRFAFCDSTKGGDGRQNNSLSWLAELTDAESGTLQTTSYR